MGRRPGPAPFASERASDTKDPCRRRRDKTFDIDTPTHTKKQKDTLPGYGFTPTGLDGSGTAALCAQNFYSTGNTRAPCRRCPSGLVTTGTGTTRSSDCRELFLFFVCCVVLELNGAGLFFYDDSKAACALLAPPPRTPKKKKKVAGPGYYYSKAMAKPCPRGTWKSTTSNSDSCTFCTAGLTTAVAASTAATDCSWVKPGYSYVSASSTAAPCPVNTYNSQTAVGSSVASCTSCPGTPALQTLTTGSTSAAACGELWLDV